MATEPLHALSGSNWQADHAALQRQAIREADFDDLFKVTNFKYSKRCIWALVRQVGKLSLSIATILLGAFMIILDGLALWSKSILLKPSLLPLGHVFVPNGRVINCGPGSPQLPRPPTP